MRKERLDTLDKYGVAYDLETDLVQPGLQVPPVVCGSVAAGSESQLLSYDQSRQAFRGILDNPALVGIFANAPFDILCQIAASDEDLWPAVLAMFDPDRTIVTGQCDGRVMCIQVTEQLHAIAKGMLGLDPRTGSKLRGRYSLDQCTESVLGRTNAKANDVWRLSYALLRHVPVHLWPIEARTYPVDDAVNTLQVALAQAGLIDNVGVHDFVQGDTVRCLQCGTLPGERAQCVSRYRRLNTHEIARQCYADFALKAGAAWGFAVDHNAVDELERDYNKSHAGKLQPFIDAGIVRPDGTENQSVLKSLVVQAYTTRTTPCLTCQGSGKVPSPKTDGRTQINCDDCKGSGVDLPPEVPRAEKGGIATGADVLIESGNETLINYADYNKDQKVVEDYIPFFRQRDKKTGQEYRNVPLTLRPNVLLENGRVSYDGKIMMLPRHGKVRRCIVARPGRMLSSQDYEGSELIGHAQSCLWIVGASRLAEALNSGLNAHLALAAQFLGITYTEAEKRLKIDKEQFLIDVRQTMKPPNFGFPGRMGAAALVKQQRKQTDVHTPHPNGPTWIAKDVRGFKGLRFCLFTRRADYCGITKVTEWKGREYPPLCKECILCAEDFKKTWITRWPENVPYFDFVKKVDESGLPVVQHFSKRLRGFRHGQVDDDGEPINSGNAIANTYFSALIADAAKNALCAITRECYDKTHRVRSFTSYTSKYEGLDSPLYGSRIPVFQHDETIGDHPIDVAADAATRQAELMEEALRIACPDMHKAVKVQPTLMHRWDKRAQPVYENGRLVPWQE